MNSVLMVCMLALIILPWACHGLTCRKGHKWDFKGAHICDLCDDSTFMPEENHNKTECYPCTQVKDANTEILKRECSREEDALIVCIAGFFRDGETCKKCTVCEAGHEIQPCGGHTDTICCPSDNFYIYVNTDGSTVCKVRTLPCRQGQFFVSGHNCTLCPPGTYMVDNHHNNTACNSCQQLPNNRELDDYVAKVCNITCNSSSVVGHDGLTPDTASFNCSDLPDVYKKCQGEEIHFLDLNKTDHNCAVQEVTTIPRVVHILLIVFASLALSVYFLWLLLSKCMAINKRFLPSAAFLRDKRDTMVACIYMATIVLAFLYWLGVLIVQRENLELRAFEGLFICINIIVAVHYILRLRLPKQPKCDCAQPLRVTTG